MIRKFANLRIIEILPPLQGWATFNDDSRADALRCILSPRWGQRASLYSSAPLGRGDSKAKERGPTEA